MKIVVEQQWKLSLWARTCPIGFLYVWNHLEEVCRQAMGQGQSLLDCTDGNLFPLYSPEAVTHEFIWPGDEEHRWKSKHSK